MANKNNYWFKAHRLGIGWTPATLEGWLLVLTYILIVLVAFWESYRDNYTTLTLIKGMAPTIGFSTVVLLFIAYKKGEPLKWRWGRSGK